MDKLPKLYTLKTIPVAGHIERSIPVRLNCVECGGRIAPFYQELEFVFDTFRRCDLVASSDADVLLVSTQLLDELNTIRAKGYKYREVKVSTSKELDAHKEATPVNSRYQYFVITGHCDGPWVHHTSGKPCPQCGQIKAKSKDFGAWLSEQAGETPIQPKLVYPRTWHGEDFFFLSEPGPPLITERVAAILDKMGNLHTEQVTDRDMVRRIMPRYAARLEKQNWHAKVCSELGPADWADTDQVVLSGS